MDILRYAWRELGRRKARTLTNVFGYALVVVSMVSYRNCPGQARNLVKVKIFVGRFNLSFLKEDYYV